MRHLIIILSVLALIACDSSRKTSNLSIDMTKTDSYVDSVFSKDIKNITTKVTVNLAGIKPGKTKNIKALGKNIIIYRRTKDDIKYLSHGSHHYTEDPGSKNWKKSILFRQSTLEAVWNKTLLDTQKEYEKISDRSLSREYMIALAHSPDYSCRIIENNRRTTNSQAVFRDLCHGKLYDSAGRLLKDNNSAHREAFNLHIPPYRMIDATTIELGLSTTSNFNHSEIIKNIDYKGLSTQEKLWLAVNNNDSASIIEAVAQGADTNKLEKKGNAIDYAIINSDYPIIDFLIKQGAEPTEITLQMIELVERHWLKKTLYIE